MNARIEMPPSDRVVDCRTFDAAWPRHVAGTLSAAAEGDMLEHSRQCLDCGNRYRQHRELISTVETLLSTTRLPSDLSQDVARRCAALGPLPSAIDAVPQPMFPAAVPLSTLLAVALAAGLSGYFLGISQRNPLDDVLTTEMLGGRGRSNIAVTAMAATIDTKIVGTIAAMVGLIWLTHTRLWGVWFPGEVPRAVLIARWLAIAAVLIGLLRVGCFFLYLSALWRGDVYDNVENLRIYGASVQVLSPVWSVSFWTVLIILLFGTLNDLLLRIPAPNRTPKQRADKADTHRS